MSQPGPRRAGGEPWITDDVAEQLADTMLALSAPSRVHILVSLLDGPHSVSDLMDALNMEQSAVSHQLRVLREHRLVRAEKAGRRRLYTLYDQHVAALLHAGLDHVRRKHPAAQPGDERLRTPGHATGALS